MGPTYWKEQMKLMLKNDRPDVYKKQKKTGTLDELLTLMAQKATELFEKNLEWWNEVYPATKQYKTENPTPQEISSAHLQNEWEARDMTQESFPLILITALDKQTEAKM